MGMMLHKHLAKKQAVKTPPVAPKKEEQKEILEKEFTAKRRRKEA